MPARIVVVSCPDREPIQHLWEICFAKNWHDCPYIVDMLSVYPDKGWNANLLQYLNGVSEDFILLMLDDHFIEPNRGSSYTQNINSLIEMMSVYTDIGMVKLQAGNAWPPELPTSWSRLQEYDREHHPFKRTNLVPTMFRREWLQRLTQAVLARCGPNGDRGRSGALAFESVGTRLTMDAEQWPERILGIHRPNGNIGGHSLLSCYSNDGLREGRIQQGVLEEIGITVNEVDGLERFV